MPDTPTGPEAREALASIGSVRSAVAGPLKYPLSYDLAYGVACGLLVSGQGMPQPWSFVALVFSLALLVGLIMGWRKTYGWWVSGYSPGRARWVAIGLAAVLIGLMGLSLYGRYVGPSWLWMVSGGVGFVLAIAMSRLWMAVWRRELARGAA